MAPRVHNSGHWTIEGAVASQFENHIRAVAGLPLGDTGAPLLPVTMRNLIGREIEGVPALLAGGTCHVHHYGKAEVRAGRKLGHPTWIGTPPACTDPRSRSSSPAQPMARAAPTPGSPRPLHPPTPPPP